MSNLITILLILFASLAIVVMVAEKYGKPMGQSKQAKLSRIAIILILVMLVARLGKEVFSG
ncbi:MAG: hypothetical protein ACR2PT_04525 [Endozoicomonas sp.]